MKSFEGESGLKSFCKNHSSLKARFGILSLHKSHFPSWFEKIFLSFEYIQLLSLTIFIHPSVSKLSNPSMEDSFLFDFVAYSLKLANPSSLLSFEDSDSTTISVLTIILASTLLKYILFLYILSAYIFNWEPNGLLKRIWRYILKLQGSSTYQWNYEGKKLIKSVDDIYDLGMTILIIFFHLLWP